MIPVVFASDIGVFLRILVKGDGAVDTSPVNWTSAGSKTSLIVAAATGLSAVAQS